MDNKDEKLQALNLEISLLARQIALWIAEKVSDGLSPSIPFEDILENFNYYNQDEVKHALGELKIDGFVTFFNVMSGIHSVSPTPNLYLVFDAVSHGTDPQQDAVILVDTVLSQNTDYVRARELHAMTDNWSHRRFNPALHLIVSNVGGVKSQEKNTGYVTGYFSLRPEDKVALKRFANSHRN